MRNVLYNYIGRIGTQLIGLAVSVYVIRELPVDTYGEYAILMSIVAYVATLCSFGIASVTQRFLPEMWQRGQRDDINMLVVRWGVGSRIVGGVAAGALLLLFAGPLGRLLGVFALPSYAEVFGGVVILTLIGSFLDVVLTSILRQFAANGSLLASSALRSVGFWYVVSHAMGMAGLLAVELAAAALRVVVLSFSYLTQLSKCRPVLAERSDVQGVGRRRLTRYAGWAYLNDLGFLLFGVDTANFVVGSQLGTVSVGTYAFANRVSSMVMDWSPVSVASNVITPLFFRQYSRAQDPRELDRMFRMLNKLIYLIMLPTLAGVAAIGHPLVFVVFGEKYISAVWLIVAVLLYQVVNAYQFPLGLVVFALEKNQINVYSRVFSVYNLIADLALVGYLGIYGVVLATATAITLKNLYIYWRITKDLRLTWDWDPLARIAGNALLTALVAWVASTLVAGISGVALACVAGATAYAGLTLASGVFSDEEVMAVHRVLGRNFITDRLFSKALMRRTAARGGGG